MSDEKQASFPRKILYALLLLIAGSIYGYFATIHGWWIARQVSFVRASFIEVYSDLQRPWFLSLPGTTKTVETLDGDAVQPGLVVVSGIDGDRNIFIRVIRRDGSVVHEWQPDWFEIGPKDGEPFTNYEEPNRLPGAILHGLIVMPDASVVMNYEFLSTVRLDACGGTMWALANRGHHFLNLDNDGMIMTGSSIRTHSDPTGYQNQYAPLSNWTVQWLSPDGKILRDLAIFDILEANDLTGLMHLSTLNNTETSVANDTLHLNDAEVFPDDWESAIFAPGDLLLSLRNINTVMVVDPETLEIKFRSTGQVLRQHDADFVQGDLITIYDNRNLSPSASGGDLYSRIVEIDAKTGNARVLFQGEGETAFYSNTLGRQQRLDNGNLMLISPHDSRVMELDKDGRLLWQYYNRLDDDWSAVITEAQVLPPEMDIAFFENARAACAD